MMIWSTSAGASLTHFKDHSRGATGVFAVAATTVVTGLAAPRPAFAGEISPGVADILRLAQQTHDVSTRDAILTKYFTTNSTSLSVDDAQALANAAYQHSNSDSILQRYASLYSRGEVHAPGIQATEVNPISPQIEQAVALANLIPADLACPHLPTLTLNGASSSGHVFNNERDHFLYDQLYGQIPTLNLREFEAMLSSVSSESLRAGLQADYARAHVGDPSLPATAVHGSPIAAETLQPDDAVADFAGFTAWQIGIGVLGGIAALLSARFFFRIVKRSATVTNLRDGWRAAAEKRATARVEKREKTRLEAERVSRLTELARTREKFVDDILGWDSGNVIADDDKRDRLIAGFDHILTEPDMDTRRKNLQIFLTSGIASLSDSHYLRPILIHAAQKLSDGRKQTRDDAAYLIHLFLGVHAMAPSDKARFLEEIIAPLCGSTVIGTDTNHDVVRRLAEWRGMVEKRETRQKTPPIPAAVSAASVMAA